MNLRIPLIVGALFIVTTVGTEVAEARGGGRVWFGGGGGVRLGARGGVSVRWSRPARTIYRPRSWSVGGSVYVGGGYYPRYRYRPYYYYQTYVPSYYGASYYPVAPSAAPSVAVVAPIAPELPKFGIGLFAGGVAVEDTDESSDMGLLGRLRLGHGGLFVEGELGKTSYVNDLRVDRRLGGSLLYEIGTQNRLAPYVLAGIGVQQADVAGEFSTTQSFAELGIGLRYAVTPRVHLMVDVRAGSRNSMSSDQPAIPEPQMDTLARTVAPPASESDESEEYTRARLSALLYF